MNREYYVVDGIKVPIITGWMSNPGFWAAGADFPLVEEEARELLDWLADEEARVVQAVMAQHYAGDECALCINRKFGFTRADCLFNGQSCGDTQG